MRFDPKPNDVLRIGGKRYQIAEHPYLFGQAYLQEGRKSWIYKLQTSDSRESYALKVFKLAFRNPHIAHNSANLGKYVTLSGMRVCQRFVVTPDSDPRLLKTWPDLEYSVLMPWIDGVLWLAIVMQKMTLTWETSFTIALKAAETLLRIEKNGDAHCDIVGDNVMVDLASRNIELLDVEDMFGMGFSKPVYIPMGGAGYQHRQSQLGQWHANADRFAGSILLAEMLTWYKTEIREAAFGEQYFDPREMQEPRSQRYRLLVQSLSGVSSGLAELLERAWYSASFCECPRASEWADVLRQVQTSLEKVASRDTSVQEVATEVTSEVYYQLRKALSESSSTKATITSQLRLSLINALLSVPAAATFQGRTALLGGIPSSINLNRNNINARSDVEGIVDQLSDLGRLASGDWPLLVLIDNVLPHVAGTQIGQELETVRETLTDFYGGA